MHVYRLFTCCPFTLFITAPGRGFHENRIYRFTGPAEPLASRHRGCVEATVEADVEATVVRGHRQGCVEAVASRRRGLVEAVTTLRLRKGIEERGCVEAIYVEAVCPVSRLYVNVYLYIVRLRGLACLL